MRQPPNSRVRRVLVVKLSSLGDLFHALPAVHAVKEMLGAAVDWVVQPPYAELVRCFADVERAIVFPRRGFVRGLPAFARELRARRYDLTIDLQGLFKSGLVAAMARGGWRLGPSFCREGSRVFYHAVAGPADRQRHAVEQCMDTARRLGADTPARAFPIAFPPAAPDGPAPRVVIVPASRWASKNWPPEHFAAVARELRRQCGATIILSGGPDDAEAARRVESLAGPGLVNRAGRTSLVEAGSLMAQAQLVVTNDSGPMHVAAALGVPVVAVFGPTDPARTGPYGDRHRVLRGECPLMPCLSRICRFGQNRCLAELAPERVVAEALDVLRKAGCPSGLRCHNG